MNAAPVEVPTEAVFTKMQLEVGRLAYEKSFLAAVNDRLLMQLQALQQDLAAREQQVRVLEDGLLRMGAELERVSSA